MGRCARALRRISTRPGRRWRRWSGPASRSTQVTAKLVEDGVQLFADAFDKLLGAVARKRAALLGEKLDSQTSQALLPTSRRRSRPRSRRGGTTATCAGSGPAMRDCGPDRTKRNGLAGSTSSRSSASESASSKAWPRTSSEQGFTHVLLLGMGGSSLGPEVLAETFGRQNGASRTSRARLDRPGADSNRREQDRSGANAFHRVEQIRQHARTKYPEAVFLRVAPRELSAPSKAGSRFIAITDPGSPLQKVAERDRFRHIAYGIPSIGGRYSVLSDFGLVPAAAMGLDIGRLLGATQTMVRSCGASVPPADNPGVVLGTILGALAKGRPRQGHHRRLARHCRFRRLAGTAPGRIDRQAGQGAHSGRCRAARPADVYGRSPVRLSAAVERSGCQAG